MKILANAGQEAADIKDPYKLLYMMLGGYETPDGKLSDLSDFVNTVMNIPFKVRVFFEWVALSHKKGTYELHWYYVDGSEWDAYSDIEVEARLGGFVDVCAETEYYETGEVEMDQLKVFMHSAINYDYYSSPVEDAMYAYMAPDGKGRETIISHEEDALDTDDKVIVEIEALMDMPMCISKLDTDHYDNCNVYVKYKGSGATIHDVRWHEVPKDDPDYEWI